MLVRARNESSHLRLFRVMSTREQSASSVLSLTRRAPLLPLLRRLTDEVSSPVTLKYFSPLGWKLYGYADGRKVADRHLQHFDQNLQLGRRRIRQRIWRPENIASETNVSRGMAVVPQRDSKAVGGWQGGAKQPADGHAATSPARRIATKHQSSRMTHR